MAKQAQVEVGSRWQFNGDTKGRVFFVYEKLPFGRLLIKQEGRAVTGETKQADLQRTARKLEGINDSMSAEKINREAHLPSAA